MAGEIARWFVTLGASDQGLKAALTGAKTGLVGLKGPTENMKRELRGMSMALGEVVPGLNAASFMMYGMAGGSAIAAVQLGRLAFSTGLAGEEAMHAGGGYTQLAQAIAEARRQGEIGFATNTQDYVRPLAQIMEDLAGGNYTQRIQKWVLDTSLNAIWPGFGDLLKKNLGEIAGTTHEITGGVTEAQKALGAYWGSVEDAGKETTVYANAADSAAISTGDLLQMIRQVPGAMLAASHGTGDLAQSLSDMIDPIRGQLASMVAGGFISPESMQAMEDAFLLEQTGIEDLRNTDERAYDDRKALSIAYWMEQVGRVRSSTTEMRSMMESAVRQVMTPTFAGDPTGVLDMLGMHVDTADEDARRLAAVMANGLHSEWTGYFKDKGLFKPEDLVDDKSVVAASARLLQRFDLGLEPGLWNKETVKQQVKDMLQGQANMKGIAEEVMAELGTAGIKVSLPTVQAAMGDFTGTGSLSATNFKTGFESGLSGVKFVDLLAKAAAADFNKNIGQLDAAAGWFARRFSDQFEQQLSTSTGFVDALTKRVMGNLNDALDSTP